jgi:glucosamine-6-phosphate deaminase
MKIMCALIEDIKPHQIYAAGDLADPHGTHKVCLDSLKALKRLKSKRFMDDCWMWLYRGAWHEWESWQIEMAVPMSPDQVLKNVMQYFTISLKRWSDVSGMILENLGSCRR